MTVNSFTRDHDMEKDGQRRSESRRDGSAAPCSQVEKRPLDNNILINAPGKRSHRAGPHSARAEAPFTLCFHYERGILGPLRSGSSSPTMKVKEVGGTLRTIRIHLVSVPPGSVTSVSPFHPVKAGRGPNTAQIIV